MPDGAEAAGAGGRASPPAWWAARSSAVPLRVRATTARPMPTTRPTPDRCRRPGATGRAFRSTILMATWWDGAAGRAWSARDRLEEISTTWLIRRRCGAAGFVCADIGALDLRSPHGAKRNAGAAYR